MKRETQKNKLPLILLAGGVLAVIALLVILLAGGSPKADPFAYISVDFSGYDGNGETEVRFRKGDMIEELILEEMEKNQETGAWLLQYDLYDRSVQLTCTPEEGLSNGDKVTVEVTVAEAAQKKIAAGEKTFEVSGLPEIQEADIFRDVNLSFEGIGDYTQARLELASDSELLRRCNFKIEPQYGIANGDTITVILQNPEMLAKEFLVLPKEIQKTFTVSGLDEYLTDPDLLPEDTIRGIIDQFLVDSVQEDWSWHHYTAPEYYKTYFFTAQEDSFLTNENMLQIYVHIERYSREEFDTDLYVPLVFTDIILHPDGSIDLDYEQGVSVSFYSTPENILKQTEDGYDVEEVYIEY